jgi:Tfp pilus assembly protein PilX
VSSNYLTNRRSFGYPHSLTKNTRGFALLITITLLAFLVLLLVSLASLTRVETQVAANNQTLAQARQNALMALNIAVGQLQKYAGPDARVTAQASLIGATVANPWFTGVWDADTSTGGTTPMSWLVSGNETSALSVNQTTNLNRTASNPDVALVSKTSPGQVRLVGAASAEMTADVTHNIAQGAVVVPAVPIQGSPAGFPEGSDITLGRYAWWVGDQGVKASLALQDRASEVRYAPWYDASGSTPVDQTGRIRQQIGSGASYFRTNDAVSNLPYVRTGGFDALQSYGSTNPALLNNDYMGRVVNARQLELLTSAGGAVTQADFIKDYYHDFTGAAYSVLANTRTDAYAGLMRDLSLKPDQLGSAFVKYADYNSYMEAPAVSNTAIPSIDSSNSPRRRYQMQPFSSAAGGSDLPEVGFSIAPVLNSFYIQFYFYKTTATGTTAAKTGTFLRMQSRMYVALWNPYASSLVPSATGLSMEFELPTITANGVSVDLNRSPGSMASGGVTLPFGSSYRYTASAGTNNYGAAGEMASWLPGRVYSWASDTSTTSLGFYTNSVTAWVTPGVVTVDTASNTYPDIVIPAATITVRLKLNGVTVSTYEAKYDNDAIPGLGPASPTPGGWSFAYAFRLNQPRTYNTDRTWLAAFDPRSSTLTQTATPVSSTSSTLVSFNTSLSNSSLPSIYNTSSAQITTTPTGTTDTTAYLKGNLLFRNMGSSINSMSTYNDVSLFDLPRLPLLSVGELQHLQVKNQRPFSIGNSWGGATNSIFDRFFFSGTPTSGSAPILENNVPLPNWNLRPVAGTNLATLQGEAASTKGGLSSRYLLQAGAFNINSTSVPAWRAVLSSVRFGSSAPFISAKIVNDTSNTDPNAGTQDGSLTQSQTFSKDTTLGANPAPVFFRLPQSAQEVFYWAYPGTETSSSHSDHLFTTSAFRLGVRGYNDPTVDGGFSGDDGTFNGTGTAGSKRQAVTTDQLEVLATEIVSRLRTRFATKGPFRNLQEFLSETNQFGGKSLLEDAIAVSGINPVEVQPANLSTDAIPSGTTASTYSGFSTQTLTQADLLTALAPYLRSRSDTFVIRTYGETINPVTGQVAGKAWAEATVQRYPDPVDSADNTDARIAQPQGSFGRRFKIISFRWLSSADI